MLPHSNGNYSERESTKSIFKRAFGFKRKQGPSQDDPGFQSDWVPQRYSHMPNAVPTSSNAVTSTGPTRRPNPKVALQFASNTLQAWGRKPKQPVHPPKPLPDLSGVPPLRSDPHVYDPRPRASVKTPPPLLLPIQSRVFQRTSQLLPGPDISAALEYMMDATAHDDKRKSNRPAPPEEPTQPVSQPGLQPVYPPLPPTPPTHSPLVSPLPNPPSAHALPGTTYQPPPQSPTQSPSRPVPRRASIGSDSHTTSTQQLKRRSASLGTLDVPSVVIIASSDPSPSTPNQLPLSSNVPPSSYHAPPSKTIHVPPAQPPPGPASLVAHSPPRSPPYISESPDKLAGAGSLKHAQPFHTEIQNMQGGSLNSRIGLGIRGKLAGWTNGAGETPSSSLSSQREHSRSRSAGGLIGQFAPAATSVAKRAYEKVNNLWLGGHSNTSQSSVGRGESGSVVDREGSNKPWHGRTPNGPSGNWSGDERAGRPGSSGRQNGSGNDGGYASDAMGNGLGSGPQLGTILRPPFRRVAPGHGGVVFGRPLAECVRDTKPLVVLGNDGADIGIEGRFIPALVLRCVQHLELWGVQEEGLFRCVGVRLHLTFYEHSPTALQDVLHTLPNYGTSLRAVSVFPVKRENLSLSISQELIMTSHPVGRGILIPMPCRQSSRHSCENVSLTLLSCPVLLFTLVA
jgi:hypothetical protein